MTHDADVAIIILTHNEEANVAHAIRSVTGWARQIIVLDSFSTDRTTEIARALGAEVYQHAFTNYSAQRQYALEAVLVVAPWVFFLDADEWIPPALRDEILATVARNPEENGFYVRYRLMWNGTWIRRGYYGAWILRLLRHGYARCDSRTVGEHIMVDGKAGYLRNDFIHEDRKGLSAWISKHNAYSSGEAMEMLRRGSESQGYLRATPFGAEPQRKRWLRDQVWSRLPTMVRPFLYFIYRYVFRGGFLDGRQAFAFHFMQALWHQLLIDLKYVELRRAGTAVDFPSSPPAESRAHASRT